MRNRMSAVSPALACIDDFAFWESSEELIRIDTSNVTR